MITQLRKRPHTHQSGFASRRMLIALLGLSGFTGMALGGLYLAGDARSDAAERHTAVSVGSREPAAARARLPTTGGSIGDAVAMVAGMDSVATATDAVPRGLPSIQDAEESPHAAERILHITNVGDRIVITDSISGARMIPVSDAATEVTGEAYTATAPVVEPVTAPAEVMMATVEPVVATAPVTNVPMSGGVNRPQPPADEEEDAGNLPPRADYEDVYPGCPRVLPQGAGEEMANERLALYGCLYYAVCAMPSDDSPATCTWYLNQKI